MIEQDIEDQIRDILRNFTVPDEPGGHLDVTNLPESKIRSLFLYQLFKALGTRLEQLLNEIGYERLLNLLLNVANVENIDKTFYNNFLSGRLNELRAIKGDISADNLWDKFLILLGMIPYYSDILQTYFGEDGLLSLLLLLKSLESGRLDLAVPFYSIDRYLGTENES